MDDAKRCGADANSVYTCVLCDREVPFDHIHTYTPSLAVDPLDMTRGRRSRDYWRLDERTRKWSRG